MPANRLTRENISLLHPIAYQIALGLSNGTLALPIELTFPTPQQAQHNRCRIYDFRRQLRIAVDKATKAPNAQDMALFEPFLRVLESIESPRIDYKAKGPTKLILRARGTSPAENDALAQLAALSTVVDKKSEDTLHSPSDLSALYSPDPEFRTITRIIDGPDGLKAYTFQVPFDDNSSDKMLLLKAALPSSGITLLHSESAPSAVSAVSAAP